MDKRLERMSLAVEGLRRVWLMAVDAQELQRSIRKWHLSEYKDLTQARLRLDQYVVELPEYKSEIMPQNWDGLMYRYMNDYPPMLTRWAINAGKRANVTVTENLN